MKSMKYLVFLKGLAHWNRRLHIHIGLFLLLFIWLFSFSGLLLNHSSWDFASFWEQKKETKTITNISVPKGLDSLQTVKRIMLNLNISGEISNLKMTPDSVDFRVSVPGHIRNLHVDLNKGICVQNEMRYNFWGKIKTLHTFNGANRENPALGANWLVSRIWIFSMDGIAIGLIYLCISSWIMWYNIRENYRWGTIVLITGFAVVIYFLFILGML
mgnify:CR=1 FL=1|tara:strand:+ start:2511 stop:3155 length:645 start_codon:yes stop_codon:yes gene_type:complete